MIVLPFPPSMNRLWRNVRGRTLLSADGRSYRLAGVAAVMQAHEGYGQASVAVSIDAWLPDKRRRDADNMLKAPLDVLTYSGVIADDSQIIRLSIYKAGIDKANPRLEVTITRMDGP